MHKYIFFGMVFFSFSALSQTYSYDQSGRINQLAYPDGQVVSYEYDSAGNITNVSVGEVFDDSAEVDASPEQAVENEETKKKKESFWKRLGLGAFDSSFMILFGFLLLIFRLKNSTRFYKR